MNALYNAGIVYNHKLNDSQEAILMFKRLSDEFLPENKAIAGLYELYLIYKSTVNNAQSNIYKNQILTNFKSSDYAKLIKDPNYLMDKEVKIKQENKEYSLIYNLFEKKYYDEVIKKVSPKLNDSTNILFCKYSYLNALSYGNIFGSTDSLSLFENALAHTVINCKGSPYYTPAKKTLDKIRNIESIKEAESGKSSYIFSSEQLHFFVLFYPKKAGNINSAKNKLSDFNKSYFSKKGLKTSSSFLNSTDQLILIKTFKDIDDAMDYYVAFKVNDKQVKALNKTHDFFLISEKNLAALYLEKTLSEYIKFFKANYLN